MSSNTDARIKSRAEAQGFRCQNRTIYLKTKRGGLLEESQVDKEYTVNEVKELSEKLKKKKSAQVLQQLRNSFAFGEDFVTTFLSIPFGLTELVGCLTSGDISLSIEACLCLINLTTGKHKSTFLVLKASAPYLITFLRGSNLQLQDCSAWALGNMAADCNSCRKHLKEQGLLEALLQLLDSSDPNVLDSTVFALSCYTKFCDKHNRDICQLGAVDKVSRLLIDYSKSPLACIPQLLTLLFNLTSKVDEVAEFFKTNLIGETFKKVVNETKDSEYSVFVTTALIRCVGNLSTASISSGIEDFTNDEDIFFPFLMSALTLSFNHIKKESLWMLSNLLQTTNSFTLKHENRQLIVKAVGDISLKTLDETTISECVNVLYLLISNTEANQNDEIEFCLKHLEEALSKRPHSAEIAMKLAQLNHFISITKNNVQKCEA